MQYIQRIIRVMIITIITALCLTSATDFADADVSRTVPMVQEDIESIDGVSQSLLPPGCGNVTPGGETLSTSCLSGSVWLRGVPIEGAEVTIIAPNGQSEIVHTQAQTGSLIRPQYGLALSGAPLNIAEGQSIQIMAAYADRSVTIDYVVKAGTQRVDLALPSASPSNDYIYVDQLWYPAEPGRLRKPRGIALDREGNLYVVDRENQRVQVFDPAGNAIRQWGDLGNGREQFFSPFGIAIDGTDNVYVTDTGNHRVLKFNKMGRYIDEIGSFGSELGQLYSPEGVVVDSRGSIYVADSANHRIQKFGPDGKLDEAFGNGGAVGTLGGSGGAGNVKFRYPTALAVDSRNNLYVTDYQNNRVQKFDQDGTFLLEFGTFGHCSSADDCEDGEMYLPDGIAIDQDDMIYISDTNHHVQKFDSQGNWIALFGERGIGNAQFEYPKGLAVNGDGHIYIAGEFNHRIQIVDSTFAWLGTWGSSGSNEKQLSSPQGTTVDSDGNLYVADNDENRVQKFDNTGDWVMNIGQFNDPQDVAVDSQGNLYVADSGNDHIQKLDKNGNVLVTIGGVTGNENGQFKQPVALDLDDKNNIYVVDRFNHRIQKFNANGIHIATWGGPIGSSTAGKFNAPTDIAVGIGGNIYVADGSNHRIQKFDNIGAHLATISEFGTRDGQFDTVTGVDVDTEGNIYAVDETGRIQKFSPDGNHLATWGAAPILGETGGHQGDIAPRFNQLDKELRITMAEDGNVYVSDTKNNRIQTYTQNGSGKPIAFISWIESLTIEQGGSLKIRGMGQDTDISNNIVRFEWTSSKDGNLFDNEFNAASVNQSTVQDLVIPYDQLSPGTHSIGLRVQDDEGEWSEISTATIYVYPPMDPNVVWTFLLYLAADYADNGLLLATFNEKIEQLQQNFSNPNVRVVIQLDGPGANDTRRIKLTPGNPADFEDIFMNELEMDTAEILSDFIRWGQGEFPAENYYLTIASHGQAIQGIAWDKTSDAKNGMTTGSSRLTIKEMGIALSADDVAPIGILHLDAGSMNLLEVAYEVRNATDYLIASQWLTWDYFAYDDYIANLDTSDAPGTVAEKIVQQYATLAEADDHPFTISVLDMKRSEVTLNAIDDLASELVAYIETNPDKVPILQDIRENIQTFESNSDYQNTPLDMYIDLVSWARELQTTPSLSQAVRRKAGIVTEELIGRMIRVSHAQSQNLPDHIKDGDFIDNDDAKGLSIFYPVNQYSIVFQEYAEGLLFSFTDASVTNNWLRFLKAATEPLPPGQQPDAPLPPLPPLDEAEQPSVGTATVNPTATPTPYIETVTATPTTTPYVETATATPTTSLTPTLKPTSTPIADPISVLGAYCPEVLPPEAVQLPNCLIGLVYINGQPADNITVQIQSQDGRADTTQTRIHLGREKRPYYSFDLGKLEIDKGESFEVIVEYDSQSYKVEYIAQPGLQQLDLVIPSADQTRPIANIRHQSSQILYEDQTLILDGIGLLGITNTTVTGYRWSSDRQGELGGAPMLELPVDNLEAGSHTISLQVQDSEGNWSAPTETTLDVNISGEATWTILLYLSADFYNSDGMHHIFQETLKHMSEKLNTNAIQIAAQVDGPREGDTERWLIQNGKGYSEFCANTQCEAATDDPESLIDFLQWAQTSVPAEHYYLVIADHGQGIQGTAWDSTSDLVDDEYPNNNSAYLTIRELGDALNSKKVEQIDILHLDACSMNLLETAFELHEKIDVLISSQYLAWNYFAYDQYLPFFSDPRRTPQEIAQRIVQHYAAQADSDGKPFTISALDMTQASALFTTFNQFINQLLALMESGQLDAQTLKTVREAVQTFDSNDNQVNDRSDYYIDLFDWSTQLTSVLDDRELKGQALDMARYLYNFVIANRSGSDPLSSNYGGQYLDLKRANGLSIFYPMDYKTVAYAEYINHELFSFTAQSLWPDFLQAIGGTVQSAANLEPLPGPLGHLDIQRPEMIYLPVIMR